jgi:hypothetical protein
LHDYRQDSDQGHSRQQHCGAGRGANDDKGNSGKPDLPQDQVATVHEVAERYNQHQAERVTDLCQSYDDSDRGRFDAKIARHRVEERLRIIDVGDAQAACNCKHEDQHKRKATSGWVALCRLFGRRRIPVFHHRLRFFQVVLL